MVLGNHTVLEQGSWSEIKTKTASLEKFSVSTHDMSNTTLSANFHRLNAQLRVKDEDEVDLARQTGDTALYGE